MNDSQCSPHAFQPLRWWDKWSALGRCSACMAPSFAHEDIVKRGLWPTARAIGDKSKAERAGEGE